MFERLWWAGNDDERYWCEITDRPDVGSNLKCPQADARGNPYWSYSLIENISSGGRRIPLLHAGEGVRRRFCSSRRSN